jgi:hypothetical protein
MDLIGKVKLDSPKKKLQEWTRHSTLISVNLKLVEMSKNHFNTFKHLHKLY